jgi:aryl-alcohol dehydrogenase-like predicted oxidoreductase
MGGVVETRRIGALEVSLVGLGCNNFGARRDPETSTEVIQAALDAGITFFDTADTYGNGRSEEIVGKALAGRRSEVIIASKFGNPFSDDPAQQGAGARWIGEAVEGSLRRLGTDYIDLYQQHVPDDTVPIEESLTALDQLVASGKVRAIGNSNFSAAQIDEAAAVAGEKGLAPFVSAQNNYSLLRAGARDDIIPAAERNGLAFLPFFPLASGMLTGKYTRGAPLPTGTRLAGMPAERAVRFASDRNFDLVEALTAVAEQRGHTILDLAFAWLTAQSAIASVIAGATSPAQIAANVAAAQWTLDTDDLAAVDAVLASCT